MPAIPAIYKSSDLNFKDIDTVKGIVQGYFASFNTLDADGDIFAPTAFNNSIQLVGPKSANPRIKHFMDHDRRNTVAVIQELVPDNFGLLYTSKAGSHTAGQDFLKMALDGIITEHSVGISYISDKMRTDEDGNTILMEVKLWEGSSLQAWGANSQTPLLGVKSLEGASDYLLTLEKSLKKGTYTDEAFIHLEKLYKQIGCMLKKEATEPNNITQPEMSQPFDSANFLQQLSTALKK